MLKESLYYSKILLFGEYGIIEDSMGLSIPYSDYNGKFLISNDNNEESRKSNSQLNGFFLNLKKLEKNNSLPCKGEKHSLGVAPSEPDSTTTAKNNYFTVCRNKKN